MMPPFFGLKAGMDFLPGLKLLTIVFASGKN